MGKKIITEWTYAVQNDLFNIFNLSEKATLHAKILYVFTLLDISSHTVRKISTKTCLLHLLKGCGSPAEPVVRINPIAAGGWLSPQLKDRWPVDTEFFSPTASVSKELVCWCVWWTDCLWDLIPFFVLTKCCQVHSSQWAAALLVLQVT